jgi:hypothetical protein
VQKPKERTLIGPAEAPSNRATSSRNAGRNHLGTPSEIKSECRATSSRIRGRLPPESAAAIGSNLYFDDIRQNGKWISQKKVTANACTEEETGYTYFGANENGLLVVLAA